MSTIQDLIDSGEIVPRPGIYVIPNVVKESVIAKIRAGLSGHQHTEADVEYLWQQILSYYGQYGTIPDFTIDTPNTEGTEQ